MPECMKELPGRNFKFIWTFGKGLIKAYLFKNIFI